MSSNNGQLLCVTFDQGLLMMYCHHHDNFHFVIDDGDRVDLEYFRTTLTK